MTKVKTALQNKIFNILNRYSSWCMFSGSMIVLLVIMVIPNPLIAHKGATGVVKERMDRMDKIGKNMKGIKSMIQGKETFSPETIAKHAESIREISTHIQKTFPEGSLQGKSEALPSIWENWEKFATLLDRLTEESERLKEVANKADRRAIMKQFVVLGKICRNCHTDFRKKKEK